LLLREILFLSSSHGLAFYNDLRDTLKKLEKKVNDFYQKREKEKAEFLAKKVKDGNFCLCPCFTAVQEFIEEDLSAESSIFCFNSSTIKLKS